MILSALSSLLQSTCLSTEACQLCMSVPDTTEAELSECLQACDRSCSGMGTRSEAATLLAGRRIQAPLVRLDAGVEKWACWRFEFTFTLGPQQRCINYEVAFQDPSGAPDTR